MKHAMIVMTTLVMAPVVAGCGDDRSPILEPIDKDVSGMYTLAELRFDPQGSLPEVDLLARMEGTLPTLVLVSGGRAQLVFRHPDTGLVSVADAQYVIGADERVRFAFNDQSTLHGRTLLSNDMRFNFIEQPRTLVFDSIAPGGIDRARLLQLVPEWQDEQLFDPVPGRLTVVYRDDDAG